MNQYLGQALFILALLVVNGYFAAAEVALISARRAALITRAKKGSAGAKAALALMEDPSRFLAAVQVGITLVGFLASAAAAVSLSAPVAAWLQRAPFGLGVSVAHALAIVLVTLAVSYLSLVIGELAPKRLGLQRAENVAEAVARPVAALAVFSAPLIWVLSRSTDAAAFVLGVKPGVGKAGVTEEEIKLLVMEQGSLLDEEKRMIHEVFELGDTVAREVMVPRVDAVMIEDTATLADTLAVFRRSGFSRLPVFHDDPDTVVGVLLLKDIIARPEEPRPDDAIAAFMRSPTFVPETKPIIHLLGEMRSSRNQLSVVVDEYGGTAGIITVEDIVEEVIGEISDEFDRVQRWIVPTGDDGWIVDGRLPVEQAVEDLGLDLPESEEYETIAGWVLHELGHIPQPGETVETDDVNVKVLAVRRRRITRLQLTRVSASADSAKS